MPRVATARPVVTRHNRMHGRAYFEGPRPAPLAQLVYWSLTPRRKSINWVAPPPPSPMSPPPAPAPAAAPAPASRVWVTILAVVLPVAGCSLLIVLLLTWALREGHLMRPVSPPLTDLDRVTILQTDVQVRGARTNLRGSAVHAVMCCLRLQA